MKDLKVKKRKPITKQLNEKFGGSWRNIPFQGLWVCDDLDAHACYVAEGGYDMNGNYTPVPAWLNRLTVYGLNQGITHLYPM